MKRFSKIFFIVAAVFALESCEDMVQVKPRASVDDTEVLRDITTTQATLNSAYAALRSANYYGRSMILLPEVLADNCKLVNASDRSGRGQNEATNVKGSHFVHWNLCYTTINTVNLVIEAIDNNQILVANAADRATINRLKAQALFLRALFHFDLVRSYSYNPNYIIKNWDNGVPIVTTANRSKSTITLPSRPTIVEVYQQVEKDLLDAISLFTVSGNPNSFAATPAYTATRVGARALLARVYLYWAGPLFPEKYQQAVNLATDAIGDVAGVATLATTGNFVANWVTNAKHDESIFEVRFATTAENLGGDNSLEGWYTRRLTAAGARTGWGDVIASDEIVAAYTGADLRANASLLATAANRPSEPASSRETRKFSSITSPTNFGLDNVPVIRLAEMYLIRAEAFSFIGGNDAAALADLNIVRARVGLTALTGLTGTALRTEIFNERRRELAFEGHRWFDFTRRGIDVGKPGGNTISYQDDRILANIPLDQIQANANLKQNPGY